jgi:putative sigma-54 modulation protein
MHIKLTGHHVDVSRALRRYVQTKFKRLERHFDNMTDVHVILTTEKPRNMAEASIQVRGGRLFAESEHEDMYAAIDLMVDKLDVQIKKHKEKLTDHHRAEGRFKQNVR